MGKTTYSDFLSSPESIASNVLVARLKSLKEYGIIDVRKDEKRKNIKYYFLTDMGKDLLPILANMALWYEKHVHAEPEPISKRLTDLMMN